MHFSFLSVHCLCPCVLSEKINKNNFNFFHFEYQLSFALSVEGNGVTCDELSEFIQEKFGRKREVRRSFSKSPTLVKDRTGSGKLYIFVLCIIHQSWVFDFPWNFSVFKLLNQPNQISQNFPCIDENSLQDKPNLRRHF